MPRVPAAVAKQRTRELSALFRSYSPYEGRVRSRACRESIHETARRADRRQVGQVYRVLVTEIASDGAHYVGHTKAYEQVQP
jgi:threonylcarbamoyladenosine tRNA methylthiotransferase CDKAL1